MFRKILAAQAIVLSLLATPSTALQFHNGGFWSDGVGFDSQVYAVMLYRLQNDNGMIQICGSYYTKGDRSRMRSVIKNYRIMSAGNIIITNTLFFRNATSEEDMTNVQQFGCKTTNKPWFEGANDQVTAKFTKTRY